MPTFESIVTPQPLAGPPTDDHALSRSLLARVASRELDGALRIWRPVPALALSRLDMLRPGSEAAIAAARRAGVATVRRESGGHAVLLGPGSLSAGFAEPAASYEGSRERYERMTDAIVGALADLGIDAEQGELPGEWCPGTWSIRAGSVKLAGLAQRAVKGGAWVEAVIELAPDDAARELLVEIYAALELPLDPSTFGSVAEVSGADVAFDDFAAALSARLAPTDG
jgi:lipoate-protein ligase A